MILTAQNLGYEPIVPPKRNGIMTKKFINSEMKLKDFSAVSNASGEILLVMTNWIFCIRALFYFL